MADTNLNLDHYWMPFTANRQFKARPRLLAGAKGMIATRRATYWPRVC